jgi:hypothetical protein
MSGTPHEIVVTASSVGMSAVHIVQSIEAIHLDSGNIKLSADMPHPDRKFASPSLGKQGGVTRSGSFFRAAVA